ncbi:hypothetical protein [Leptospira vanthielii]|uniref:Uncharacterized protein n=1 Tax=Leptospira vanthielii serovar Holland str. Waz Holland = ATCC 700522 TaxID=1218591 RepID=N1VXD7_9LEPT|nr:hypothetical protein [Leptospira vanthielii]EMY68619.1 hypothetical protein LEP1GSC199_1590 [Leptospira vanthielii serovar Holland str. Waz Holland = ATCC 700522]
MGQQIQLFATKKDLAEIQFYLEGNFRCKFYQSFSNKRENIQIKDFSNLDRPYNRILIWNTDFFWNPEYGITKTQPPYHYIKNESIGPIIEICKSNFESKEAGRIYWAKNFLSNKLEYDVANFEIFFKKFLNWIKKSSIKHKSIDSQLNIYYMDDALRQINSRIE